MVNELTKKKKYKKVPIIKSNNSHVIKVKEQFLKPLPCKVEVK